MDIHSSCLSCLSLPVCYRLLLCGFLHPVRGEITACAVITPHSHSSQSSFGAFCVEGIILTR